MKSCFSIDALSSSGKQAWRLQEDGRSWRSITYAECLQAHDARIGDEKELQAWQHLRMRADKERGLIPYKKMSAWDILVRGVFTHLVLHRQSSAPIPDKAQMIQCMSSLTVGTPWLLYLNIAGQFQAIDTSTTSILNSVTIAVRGEIASSAEYIGELATQNETMMDELYRQFLGGWLEHLKSKNMQVFVPDTKNLKEESDWRARIDAWQPENLSCA